MYSSSVLIKDIVIFITENSINGRMPIMYRDFQKDCRRVRIFSAARAEIELIRKSVFLLGVRLPF
jgi:hypothetical protein